MKLSLKMIAERLELSASILRFKDMYSTIRLSQPVFLANETVLSKDSLYITSAEELSDTLKYEDGCALIVLGSEDTNILHCPAVILLDSSHSKDEIFSFIEQIFSVFNEWEQRLVHVAGNYEGIEAFSHFLSASEGLFENTLSLSDSAFNYLSHGETDTLPKEFLNALELRPFYPSLNAESDVFIISDAPLKYRIMIKNLFLNGTLYYRLTLSENHHHFRESDYLLIEILASYLQRFITVDMPRSLIPLASNEALPSDPAREAAEHFFRDILPSMKRTALTQFSADDMLSPIYLKIKAHDELNNTEYLKTLEEYLRQNLNAVQTAQALFVHRATLIYRIKRICEIGHTDLKKPDELLHLALSFHIDA